MEEYQQYTRTVAALERADDVGLNPQPGQNVSYVVVNDSKRSCDRIALAYEASKRYDTAFYADQLLRTTECVLASLGWRRAEVAGYLVEQTTPTLSAFDSR